MRYLSVILFAMVIASCATTKSKTYTEKEMQHKVDSTAVNSFRLEKDTVKIYKDRIVTKPVYNTVTIPLECDEQGNVKPVQYKSSSGKNTSAATIKNNQLIIEQAIDSIVQVREKQYKSKYIVDSTSIAKKAIELYKKQQSEKIVKQPHWLMLHYKCIIVIVALSALMVYLLNNKK